MDKKNENQIIYFITLLEVMKMTKIPKSSLPKYIKKEGFPEPVSGTERARFWVLSEVQAWMKDRIEKRDKDVIKKNLIKISV